MAGGFVAMDRDGSSRTGRSSRAAQTSGAKQVSGWIPVALGAVTIVAGLGMRKMGTVALALTAVAGVTAVGVMRSGTPGRGRADRSGPGVASSHEPLEVERSITIGKSADELRRRWLEPDTLPQIMAGFATVRAIGDGRAHWRFQGPLGRCYEWDTETVDGRPGAAIGWRSLPNAAVANEGSVRFHPAPADRGTVVRLHIRFDPSIGGLGGAAMTALGRTPLGLAADWALHRFKSLVETGEIPTTERQPAARADTR